MEAAMTVAERATEDRADAVRVPGKRTASPVSFGEFLRDIFGLSHTRKSSPRTKAKRKKKSANSVAS